MIEINDTVRVLPFPEESPNGYARVVAVATDGRVLLSNGNMPFNGSLMNAWFMEDQVEVVRDNSPETFDVRLDADELAFLIETIQDRPDWAENETARTLDAYLQETLEGF